MNRSLIEGDPHAVLEGMLIAAYAIGASPRLRLHPGRVSAGHQAPALGDRRDAQSSACWASTSSGSDFSFDIKIKEGAGAFVCGEETALIASIEGRRGHAAHAAAFPRRLGPLGQAHHHQQRRDAGDPARDRRRTAPSGMPASAPQRSKGTKTFSLVGKVRRTGLIEVPLGMTLRTVIYDIGGGHAKDFKAVQTGGPSGGCLGEEFLDTPIDYENLAAAGSIMGSGGLIVIDRDTCIVDTARYFLSFTQEESCGKCVPCRVGTRHLVEILDSICERQGELGRPRPARAARPAWSRASSLCGLGQTAPNPVLSALKYFRERVRRAHRRQALPRRRLPRPGRVPHHPRQVHRLPALRAGVPDRRHHRPARRSRTTSIPTSASSAAPATRSAASTPSPATPS